MESLDRTLFRWLTIGWLVLGVSGCGESTDALEDPLLDGGTAKSAASVNSLSKEPPVEDALIREIAEVWSATGRTCGLDHSAAPSPSEVMRNVDPKDRAASIVYVLETHQLDADRVGRLLQLLGATAGDGDEDTGKYISNVFDQAREMTTRILADQLAAYDPEDPDDEGFDVFFENTVVRIRVRALRSIAAVPGPLSLAVLERELGSADARLRQTAAIGLANREDYSDRERLEQASEELHPGMRSAVQAALDASVPTEDE